MDTLELNLRELTAQDRCDSCSAAARVIVTFLTGELLFCGHHAKEKYKFFNNSAVVVYDPDGFTRS